MTRTGESEVASGTSVDEGRSRGVRRDVDDFTGTGPVTRGGSDRARASVERATHWGRPGRTTMRGTGRGWVPHEGGEPTGMSI